MAEPACLAVFQRCFRAEGLSGRAAVLASEHLRPSSQCLYQSHWRAYCDWCRSHNVDPQSPSLANFADFLVFIHDVQHFASTTIASYRSSLAGVLGSLDGVPLSHHPTLSRLIRSFSLAQPPLPPAPEGSGLGCLSCLGVSFLTIKLVFLLALANGKRRSELQTLSRDPRDLRTSAEGVWLLTIAGFLPKTAIPGHDTAPFFVAALTPAATTRKRDERLCLVQCLNHYLRLSGGLRQGTRLFQKIRGVGALHLSLQLLDGSSKP